MTPYFEYGNIRLFNCDVLQGLLALGSESVQCCVTSPPYWGLRDYGIDGQIGLEKTPEEYIEKMVQVFRGVHRGLKKDGTLWINMGDSYWGGKGASNYDWSRKNTDRATLQKSQHNIMKRGETRPQDGKHHTLKPKDLVGIPWMLAFALRADGWYLRQDIIWSKPNPMPESVTDRPTKAHEYIFLLSKSKNYFYDQEAILEPVSPNTNMRISQNLAKQIGSERANGGQKTNGRMKAVSRVYDPGKGNKSNPSYDSAVCLPVTKRNKRSVWTVTTKGFTGAHFATFPPKLIEPCILAGSRPGDVVLDPFWGSGTTGDVAIKHGRKAVGIELSADYCDLSMKRFQQKTLNFMGE